jgi:hypothetical protein
MNRRLLLALLIPACCGFARAAEEEADPGKEVIGSVKVTIYLGTNGDASSVGPRAKEVSAETAARLGGEQKLRFSKYLELARYQNWSEPFEPSNEVMLRFEPQSNLDKGTMRLDLELWLSRKKILKTDAAMTFGKQLLVLGPDWKGGRLILAVELSPEKSGKP